MTVHDWVSLASSVAAIVVAIVASLLARASALRAVEQNHNQHVQKLVDRIAEARGNLEALATFTFKPSNTYYALAANYRDALIAEAKGA